MCVQNWKSVALPVPGIIGVPQKIGQSLDMPTLYILPAKKSIFLPNTQTIGLYLILVFPRFSIAVLSGSCEPPILEKERPWGVGMLLSERALVRPFIVTFHFPLSLRVSDILPFLFSITPFFHTPPLFSPKFPHVPVGIGGSPFGYKERSCSANCTCN